MSSLAAGIAVSNTVNQFELEWNSVLELNGELKMTEMNRQPASFLNLQSGAFFADERAPDAVHAWQMLQTARIVCGQ